jgi:hypothetical protein
MATDVEHFFIYILAICVSSSENCLFNSFALLLLRLFVLLLFNFWTLCIFWILSLHPLTSWEDCIPSCGWSTDSSNYFFWCAEIFKFDAVIVGHCRIPLSPRDRLSREKLKNKIWELNDTTDQMDLTDNDRVFHPAATLYTFFSAAHGTFSKIVHILGHKAKS